MRISQIKNKILVAYALVNSATILAYVVASLCPWSPLSYILLYGWIIESLLVVIFPLLFRRAAAVVAAVSFLSALYLFLFLPIVGPIIPEAVRRVLQVVHIPFVLYSVALFAFGRVLSSVSKIAGAIYYGVAAIMGVFALLYTVYIHLFYEIYLNRYTGVLLNLLLAVAWLIVAVEVVRKLRHGHGQLP